MKNKKHLPFPLNGALTESFLCVIGLAGAIGGGINGGGGRLGGGGDLTFALPFIPFMDDDILLQLPLKKPSLDPPRDEYRGGRSNTGG